MLNTTRGPELFSYAYGWTMPNNPGEGSYDSEDFGQRLMVLIDDYIPEVYCQLQSYTHYITQSDFVNGTYIESYISAYEVGLKRLSGNAYISGMCGIPTYSSPTQNNNLGSLFIGMIEDLASVLGYGTSTASALINMLSGADGAIQTRNDNSHRSVHVTFGTDERVNFDSEMFPLSFTLVTIGQGGPLSGNFFAYSYLTYGIDMLEAGFLVRTTTATVSDITF